MNTATSLQRRTPTAKLTPGTKGKAAGASGVDTGMTIILTTDERDLMMGVREVPTLEELMRVGLPVSVTGAGM